MKALLITGLILAISAEPEIFKWIGLLMMLPAIYYQEIFE